MITPPDYLSPRAREIFSSLAEAMEPRPTIFDAGLLAAYCDAAAKYETTSAFIAEHGDVFQDTKKVTRRRPEAIVNARYFDQMKKAADALGIDRKSRLKAAKEAPKPKSNLKSLRKPPRVRSL